MRYAAQTHVGRRLRNEDSLYLPGGSCGAALVAVADGMGGHAAGERASRLAVEGLSAVLCADEEARFPGDPMQRIQSAIRQINREIYTHSRTEEGCRGMGTTLTLAMLFPDQYIAANIGDSRLYHFDGWSVTQVTHDHSLVAVLVASGEITPAEAHVHPQRNIITRALGTAEYEEADFFQRRWAEGDTLLLCSDGLYGSICDEEMEEVLRRDASLQEQCDELVRRAIDAGATDNITVVLAQNAGGDAA
jgi:serine/threonine protein phosphatase PrpC